MRGWLALMLLTVALAGCTEAPENDPAATGGDAPRDPVYETVTVVDILETPVDWTGETDEGAWVCGAPTCPGGHAPTADNSYVGTFEFEGELSHLALDLSWTPADASQTGLEIQVTGTNGGGLVGFWTGTSSFTIDADVQADGEESITVMVWPATKDGAGTYVDATKQPFTLTGSIVSNVEREEQQLVEDA